MRQRVTTEIEFGSLAGAGEYEGYMAIDVAQPGLGNNVREKKWVTVQIDVHDRANRPPLNISEIVNIYIDNSLFHLAVNKGKLIFN